MRKFNEERKVDEKGKAVSWNGQARFKESDLELITDPELKRIVTVAAKENKDLVGYGSTLNTGTRNLLEQQGLLSTDNGFMTSALALMPF